MALEEFGSKGVQSAGFGLTHTPTAVDISQLIVF